MSWTAGLAESEDENGAVDGLIVQLCSRTPTFVDTPGFAETVRSTGFPWTYVRGHGGWFCSLPPIRFHFDPLKDKIAEVL